MTRYHGEQLKQKEGAEVQDNTTEEHDYAESMVQGDKEAAAALNVKTDEIDLNNNEVDNTSAGPSPSITGEDREYLETSIAMFDTVKEQLGRTPMIAELIGPLPNQDLKTPKDKKKRKSATGKTTRTELYSDQELSLMFVQLMSDSPDDSYLFDC